MADYLFRLLRDDGSPLAERACALTDEREVGVITFVLLREHRGAARVEVTSGPRAVARRARVGGKSELVWLH